MVSVVDLIVVAVTVLLSLLLIYVFFSYHRPTCKPVSVLAFGKETNYVCVYVCLFVCLFILYSRYKRN